MQMYEDPYVAQKGSSVLICQPYALREINILLFSK